MRITTQGVYGLVCVVRIAKENKNHPVSIQTISKKEQLPVDYIEQLLLKLRKASLVKSIRGRSGGYVLARPASKITLKNIIKAVEGDVFDTICFNHKSNGCLVKGVWLELKKKIEDYLDNITIEDLLRKGEKNYVRPKRES